MKTLEGCCFIKRILRLVPVKVKTEFFHYCTENKVTLKWNDGSYYVEFGKFIQNEYTVTLETLESSIPPEADLRNDVVKQSKKDAAENTGEVIDEILIDSLSESESNVRGNENEDDNV